MNYDPPLFHRSKDLEARHHLHQVLQKGYRCLHVFRCCKIEREHRTTGCLSENPELYLIHPHLQGLLDRCYFRYPHCPLRYPNLLRSRRCRYSRPDQYFHFRLEKKQMGFCSVGLGFHLADVDSFPATLG